MMMLVRIMRRNANLRTNESWIRFGLAKKGVFTREGATSFAPKRLPPNEIRGSCGGGGEGGHFKIIYYNLFSISSDVDLSFVLIEGLCN